MKDKWYINEKAIGASPTGTWIDYVYPDSMNSSHCITNEYDTTTGHLLSSQEFYGADFPLEYTTYDYDTNGNLTSSVKAHENWVNGGTCYETTNYNAAGNVTSAKGTYEQGTFETIFDSSGRNSTTAYYLEDGSFVQSAQSVYDYRGNTIKITNSYADGDSSTSTVSYVYDNVTGEMTSKTAVYNDGGSIWNTTYEYDENGNVIKEVVTDGTTNKISTTTNYSYDEKGNVIAVTRTAVTGTGEEFSEGFNYKYDEKGRRIRENFSYNDGNHGHGYEKEYAYDETGKKVGSWSVGSDGERKQEWHADEISVGGKKYTFNATELRSVINSLDSSKGQFKTDLSAIANACLAAGSMVESSDSNIGSEIRRAGELANSFGSELDAEMTNLSTDIATYINSTLQNESETNAALENMSQNLYDFEQSIKNLGGA